MRNKTAIRKLYRRLILDKGYRFRSIRLMAREIGLKEDTARKAMCNRPEGIHKMQVRTLIAIGKWFGVTPGFLLDETLKEHNLLHAPLPQIMPFSKWRHLIGELDSSLQETFTYCERSQLRSVTLNGCKSLLWKALEALPTVTEAQSGQLRGGDIGDALAALSELQSILRLALSAEKKTVKAVLVRKALHHSVTARSYYQRLAEYSGLEIKDS